MNIFCKNLIVFLIFSLAYTNNFHGVALQITSDGTGLYYKPGFELKQYSKLVGAFGIHLDNNYQAVSLFNIKNNNRSIYIDLSAEIQQEILKEFIVGAFNPIIFIQGGSMANINSISGIDNLGNWKLLYAIGAGFQFYNGRILNELTLKYNQNSFIEGNVVFQLAVYWK